MMKNLRRINGKGRISNNNENVTRQASANAVCVQCHPLSILDPIHINASTHIHLPQRMRMDMSVREWMDMRMRVRVDGYESGCVQVKKRGRGRESKGVGGERENGGMASMVTQSIHVVTQSIHMVTQKETGGYTTFYDHMTHDSHSTRHGSTRSISCSYYHHLFHVLDHTSTCLSSIDTDMETCL